MNPLPEGTTHPNSDDRASIPRNVYPQQVLTSASASSAYVSVSHNVRLNRKTLLSMLYTYELGSYIEYPETSELNAIGHLIQLDPSQWHNPMQNFAYSYGAPSGRTKRGREVLCSLLVDSGGTGAMVPCVEMHFTCT